MSTGKGETPDFGKGVPQQNFEAMEYLARGPKGETGEPGERGLSRLQGRAVVVLFLVAALSSAGSWIWNAREVDSNAAAQRASQASQRTQGAAQEQKLCTTLGRLAALKPPPGNPLANPSRAFDQKLITALNELAPDLGCKEKR